VALASAQDRESGSVTLSIMGCGAGAGTNPDSIWPRQPGRARIGSGKLACRRAAAGRHCWAAAAVVRSRPDAFSDNVE